MNPFTRKPPASDAALERDARYDQQLGEWLRASTPVQRNLGWEDLNARLHAADNTSATRRNRWLPAGAAALAAAAVAVVALRIAPSPAPPGIALETHWEMLDDVDMYDHLDTLLLLAEADVEVTP